MRSCFKSELKRHLDGLCMETVTDVCLTSSSKQHFLHNYLCSICSLCELAWGSFVGATHPNKITACHHKIKLVQFGFGTSVVKVMELGM